VKTRRRAPAPRKPRPKVAAKPERRSIGPQDGKPELMRIGEAARLLGVEPYVLRFWETQFSFLRPRHAASSHRLYEARDIELLRLLKRLLHLEGYTIAGARRHIREVGLERLCAAMKSSGGEPKGGAEAQPALNGVGAGPQLAATLSEIREELRSLKAMLDGGARG
jgi:DNA-binding transcriptional MerR regulator